MTSPRTAQRLTRILSMLPWVIANPGAAADEVMERFGYERRADLVDDLALVFVCGLPGYGPGDLMDAYLDEDEVVVDMADYFAARPRLSSVETLTLLAAGMALLSTGQGSPALASGVAKLQKTLAPQAADALLVGLAEEPGGVAELRAAAVDGRVVRITYTALGSGATTTRDIEPWSVFSTLGNWYVSAQCRQAGAERIFRVDRIRELDDTGDRFDPPPEPPPPVVRYTPAEDDVRATIALDATARWVAEYYPVEVVSDGDEMVIRFSASDPAVAARLLLRLGPAGRLIDGEEVAAALGDLRRRILRVYGVTSPD